MKSQLEGLLLLKVIPATLTMIPLFLSLRVDLHLRFIFLPSLTEVLLPLSSKMSSTNVSATKGWVLLSDISMMLLLPQLKRRTDVKRNSGVMKNTEKKSF